MDLQTEKAALRARALARRGAHGAIARPDTGRRLAGNFHAAVTVPAGAVVSGFWPSKGEIDVRPLLGDLAAAGHACALPVVAGRGRPLVFRAWTPETVLVRGVLDIPVPPGDAAVLEPDFLLVPLLAFDRAGNRLGWGAGYYDITLDALRATRAVTAIGIAYAAQEVDFVPHGPQDQRLDWIITETEAIRTAQA